jgi:hypothetical protein
VFTILWGTGPRLIDADKLEEEKMRAWKVVLALVLCLSFLVACGPSATLITTPAKDMNLSADQVGAGYVLSEEQGLEEFASSLDISDIDDISDANYRMFENDAGGIVLSLVITLKQLATKDDLKELTEGFEEGFTESMGDVALEEFTAPAVGDEATVRGITFPDMGMAMYFMGFRKTNVIGVLAVVGTDEFASESIIGDLGQKMAGKIK